MTSIIYKKQIQLFEYYYLYNHLFFYYNTQINTHRSLYLYQFQCKINYIFKKNYFFKKIKFLDTKKINQFLNYNLLTKINLADTSLLTYTKQITIDNKQIFLQTKLFKLFFLFNYSITDVQFPYHYNYKLFYVQNYKNELVMIDSTKIFHRWRDGLELLYNVFFYNFNSIIFSSPNFKNETLALNWNNNHFDMNLWKYYYPFFIFKLHKYNNRSGFFFEKLSNSDINFFIIVDCFYQYKNLFYLKKKNYYSVGLVSINIDPWIVTYPIIGFFENFVIQLFFFKLLILMQRRSLFFKFHHFKTLWIYFLYNKINNI